MADRIVVTGAGGQVGRFLSAEVARRGGTVVALTSAQCDITDPVAIDRVVDAVSGATTVLINCAAYTDVDAAESNETRAYQVNVAGAENLAQACARVGARFIHLSTDYVFSGRFPGTTARPYEPDDDTGPLSVYGRTKLAGELAVLRALPEATVVRTSWVYTGGAGGDFVAMMRRRAARGEPVELVDDQIGTPTYVGDLVTALLRIARGDIHEPILHAAGDGSTSRFEQGRAVYAAVGADPDLVRPVSAATNPRPAARPAYSALGSRLSTAAGIAPPRPWRDALHAALTVAAAGDR
ncbi:dTDP-4-dehydrorhamnose reductase [Mycolicibacterium komossense]|uniref:dTDP-4-dehydrorhamnose reductase n=1 Tax=Mycolicibacterium komossense TaxID=1779 RepID=A0ABT3CCN8_9MYCO|nr:dTDP-4-dehydrorhamnose reductase [Mycolicibacterium komossense]MCV7227156.1 dTDP-4-dehydrorhamnose reductase [Mycolicibacterium komossense]